MPQVKLALAGAALVLVAFGAFSLRSAYLKGHVAEHVAVANEQKGVERAEVAAARDIEAKIAARQAELVSADQAVAKARAEVDRLRALAAQHAAAPAPGAEPLPVVPDVPLDLAKDQLILAQDRQIQGLKLQLADEHARGDRLQAALDAADKRAAALELAMKAQASAAKADEWRTGFKGAAVGLVVGYLSRSH